MLHSTIVCSDLSEAHLKEFCLPRQLPSLQQGRGYARGWCYGAGIVGVLLGFYWAVICAFGDWLVVFLGARTLEGLQCRRTLAGEVNGAGAVTS